MISTNPKLPIAVKKIVFGKAGISFDNIIYLDFIGGATSTNIEISFRDNSVTSGNPDPTGADHDPCLRLPDHVDIRRHRSQVDLHGPPPRTLRARHPRRR